jgi:hypothetical protein
MTTEQFTQLFSLGIGGVIAAVVLYWKRDDDKSHKAALIAHAAELSKINTTLIKVITANTRAINTLAIIVGDGSAPTDEEPADE